MRKFRNAFRKRKLSAESINYLTETLRKPAVFNSTCARVFVKAVDVNAALNLAKREVSNTIDSINFFADLLPYNYGWLYFPEEAASVWVTSPVLGESGIFSIPGHRQGPGPGFSFEKVRQTNTIQPFVRKINKILKEGPKCDLEEILLSSIQWAGRATVESRREQAFLLFAIALESIILPKMQAEINYRLRIRTAHLLGATANEREVISKRVQRLYEIRSKIAHNGYYEVTDVELNQIRFLVKQVILKLLKSRIGVSGNSDEFDRWLERKVLS